MTTQVQLSLRNATLEDRSKLANLMHFETYVHRHLDWRHPLDWLGDTPFLVAYQRSRLMAALACPPDPAHVSWIRLFAVTDSMPVEQAWEMLWQAMLDQLGNIPAVKHIAAIALQEWFQSLLEKSRFFTRDRVVMLNWQSGSLPARQYQSSAKIRVMKVEDIPAIFSVDEAAFSPLWQNSQFGLELAFRQASVATVAEIQGEVVGYQISTNTPLGGHLARLAVLPQRQGQGIGLALVYDMLSEFERRGAQVVSVNTQNENACSLGLYKRLGFTLTGEEYPVYQYQL